MEVFEQSSLSQSLSWNTNLNYSFSHVADDSYARFMFQMHYVLRPSPCGHEPDHISV